LIDHLKHLTPKTWISIGVLGLWCAYKAHARRYVAPNTVLEIDMRTIEFKEVGPVTSGLLGLLPQEGVNVHTVVRTLLKAAKDDRIVGLVVTLDKVQATLTELEEIRDAVMTFRATGKKTLVHANTFKEFGHGTLAYWFATAFEEIYMPAIGSLNFVGLGVQTPFIRSLFTKIGAEPHIAQRRKYKSAANMFMEEKYTKEHKETTEHILNTVFEHVVNDIAAARNLGVDVVRDIITKGPYSSERAQDLKLINGVIYEDEFYDVLLPSKFQFDRGLIGSLCYKLKSTIAPEQPKGVNLLFASNFFKRAGGSPYTCGKNKVALINVIGSIHMGQSETDWDGTETSAGAESIVLAIRQAINDKKVKAILLRVSSPGGSAVASDMIAQQIAAAKSAGKKVVVSMGQYAASGGYYVSCYADKIVACPLTVTGSIGVLAGKINLKGTWAKVGVTFDGVATSDNARFFDPLTSYDEGENQAKLEAWLDDIYDKFKGHVAAGRKLTDEQVEAVAQGRVWMGTAALQNGLVDVLGGFETAVQVLKSELALKETDSIKLVKFPREASLLQSLTPAKNTRELPKATSLANWFIPSTLVRTISSAAQIWHSLSILSQRSDLRSLVQTASHMDFSHFPTEISLNPSLLGPIDVDLKM
jgi:protease-4